MNPKTKSNLPPYVLKPCAPATSAPPSIPPRRFPQGSISEMEDEMLDLVIEWARAELSDRLARRHRMLTAELDEIERKQLALQQG